MNKIKYAVFLALAGSGFYTQSANAAATPVSTANAGDVFLGFYDPYASAGQDYLIDVGSVSLYTTPGAPFALSNTYVGSTTATNTNLNTLDATDGGGNWYSDGDIYWGAFAGNHAGDPTATMYAGQPRPDLADQSNPPLSDTQAAQLGYLQNYTSLLNYFNGVGAQSAGAPYGTLQAGANSSSWASESASPAFGYFQTFTTNIDGLGDGEQLDFYKMVPTDSGGAVTYEGYFSIASTGAITYTPASSVPEPSALMALAGGAGLLGLIRRRRAVVA